MVLAIIYSDLKNSSCPGSAQLKNLSCFARQGKEEVCAVRVRNPWGGEGGNIPHPNPHTQTLTPKPSHPNPNTQTLTPKPQLPNPHTQTQTSKP